MKYKIINLGKTGIAIGDVTIVLKTLVTGFANLSQVDITLTELYNGTYAIGIPASTIIVPAYFHVRETVDPSHYAEGIVSPVDGNEVTGTTVQALRLLSGAYTVTIQFYRIATTTPIPDVLFDVYDSTETARLNGVQLKSAVNGQASFARDNGTYKIRAMLAGFTFATGTVVVNGANITLTMYGAAITIPNPPVAGTQTLFGNVRELDWGVSTGDTITAVIADKGQVVNGALIQHLNLSTTVDANSQFSLTVPKGAVIRLTVKDHGTHEITINQEDTYDVATYLTE